MWVDPTMVRLMPCPPDDGDDDDDTEECNDDVKMCRWNLCC